jgi:hypothetical protein
MGKSGVGDEGITTARYDDLSEFDTTKFGLMLVVFFHVFFPRRIFVSGSAAAEPCRIKPGDVFLKKISRGRVDTRQIAHRHSTPMDSLPAGAPTSRFCALFTPSDHSLLCLQILSASRALRRSILPLSNTGASAMKS